MDDEDYRVFQHVLGRLDSYYVEWVHQQMKPDKGDDGNA